MLVREIKIKEATIRIYDDCYRDLSEEKKEELYRMIQNTIEKQEKKEEEI